MHSLYNRNEDVEITRVPSDSYLVIDSADRSSSTSATGEALSIPNTQPYNNFRLQKPQNLVQGGFTRLQLTEINFPYAIPNVNDYTNTLWVRIANPVGGALIDAGITLPNNFYFGVTIATILTARLNATAAISSSIGIAWAVTYVPSEQVGYNGGYLISATLVSTSVAYPFALYPYNPALVGVKPIPAKSLLSVMGFNALSNWTYLTTPSVTKFSLYAPLSYTSYIDIVSSKLTYYQNVQDSSSKTNSRGGTICRLYIANESSSQPVEGFIYNGTNSLKYPATQPPGAAPFLIHRQFVCPKSFKWNKNTAIDSVDIQLYDDAGQPLYFEYLDSNSTVPTSAYPDFQITFKCTED